MSQIDCEAFLMTSRVEACPNIALEAMAHGCLCIAADDLPLLKIVEDAAVFYPARNPQLLAQRVQNLFSWQEDKKHYMKQKAKKSC